ncbi:MAG: S9 family peptidase, partial [bacterium]|nr:S9 family peptidase [bacterium]
KTVFEASKKSVGAGGNRVYSHDGSFCLVSDMISFYEQILYIYENDKLAKIDIPSDAEFENYFKKQIILKLKSDWKVGDTTYKQGSIIIGKLADIKAGKKVFKVLMEEGERFSISSVTTTRNYILVTVLDNVVSKLFRLAQDAKGNWKKEEVKIKDNISLTAFNTSKMDDDYYVTYENFLNPDSLHFMDGKTEKLEKLKGRPHYFDSTPYKIEQYEAVSKDGVKVPYFVVMRKDIKLNGRNPALVYGYGGFMVSETPFYSSHTGLYWLEKGGVYVLTNIRGGGEFGPKWHQAALLKNRMKSYEDFIAIGEDVVKRKITSPGKMAMEGGSNGGLLVGAVAVLRPDLFKGVLCAVPLLDMKRYHKLLAGASWMAEYGNPDKPDMWNYIKTYSPYHNLKKGVKYPEIFFYTSTRDDRVHPAHARKMAARMEEMGMPFYYYENMEGGHAGAANYNQRAYMRALNYAYLYKLLMGK